MTELLTMPLIGTGTPPDDSIWPDIPDSLIMLWVPIIIDTDGFRTASVPDGTSWRRAYPADSETPDKMLIIIDTADAAAVEEYNA